MKFVITLFFVACGFQVYSAKPTVFMFPDQGNHLKTIDALGAQVKSVLRPAYFKGVDDLRRTRDELEEALSNFNDAFGDTIFTIDIFTMDDLCVFGDIMEGVRNLFSGPLNTFLDTIETFLLEATNKTKQTIGKTDAQLATILNAVIVNAVKCMANLDVTATLEVKNKTGIVKLAVQKKENLVALLHLLNTQLQTMEDSATLTADKCLVTLNQQYKAAMDAVDPLQEVAVPPTVGKL